MGIKHLDPHDQRSPWCPLHHASAAAQGPRWAAPAGTGGSAPSWFMPKNIEDFDLEAWYEFLIVYA
jgi:hypothetical protein